MGNIILSCHDESEGNLLGVIHGFYEIAIFHLGFMGYAQIPDNPAPHQWAQLGFIPQTRLAQSEGT